jgi:hypothetical protein
MSHPVKNITLFGAGKESRSAARCQATSKQTKLQCGRAALPGKSKCRFHGGLSTGPKTAEGRRKCAAVRTLHGQETLEAKRGRVEAMMRIRVLADLGVAGGFLTKRISGRRPGGVKTPGN